MTTNKKRNNKPPEGALKLALAASSLLASLLGAWLLARADSATAATEGTPTAVPPQAIAPPQVIIVRRYVEVAPSAPAGGAPVSAGAGAGASGGSGAAGGSSGSSGAAGGSSGGGVSVSLPPIPTAVPYVAPVASTRSS